MDMQPSSNNKHQCSSYHASSQLASIFAESRSKKGGGKQKRRPKRNIRSVILATQTLQPSGETQTEQFTESNKISGSDTKTEKKENERLNDTPAESKGRVENFRFDFAPTFDDESGKKQSDDVSSKKRTKKKKKRKSAKNKLVTTYGNLTIPIDVTHNGQTNELIMGAEAKISEKETKERGIILSTPNCTGDSATLNCLKENHTQTNTYVGSQEFEPTHQTIDKRDYVYNSNSSNLCKSIVGIIPSSAPQTSIISSAAKASSPQSALSDEMTQFQFDPIVSNRGAMVNRNSMNLYRQNRNYHLRHNPSLELSNSGGHLNTNYSTQKYVRGASDDDNNPFTFGFRIFGEGILPPTPSNCSGKKEG